MNVIVWLLLLLEDVVQNKVDFWWGLDTSNIIVLISFIVAIWSWWYTRETVISIRNEADKDRIDKECQRLLLKDIVRHLYRNKVCTLAMQIKYQQGGGNGYPSDEHFLKLKLLPSDIYLEQFYKNPEKFHMLHELEMLLRNYNTEIDVAHRHLSDIKIDEDTKERDFATLDFKPGYLAYRILKTMTDIWENTGIYRGEEIASDYTKEVVEVIRQSHERNLDENLSCNWGKVDATALFEKEKEDYFTTKIFSGDSGYLDMLVKDVEIECGRNKKGEEKIHLIPYVK